MRTISRGRFMGADSVPLRLPQISPDAQATLLGPSFVVVVNWLEELKAAIGK